MVASVVTALIRRALLQHPGSAGAAERCEPIDPGARSALPPAPTETPVSPPAPAVVAPARTASAPDYPTAWRRLPRRIAFVGVKTSGLGLGGWDRIVSLGVVTLTTEPIDISTLHLVFNPQRRCKPHAIAKHGWDDATLERQDPIASYVSALHEYFGRADLIVAHDAAFDLSFINHEFRTVRLPPLAAETFCTKLAWRELGRGSAALDTIIGQLGVGRRFPLQLAVEDAWLVMQVFLWMQRCPWRLSFHAVREPEAANYREAALGTPEEAKPTRAPRPRPTKTTATART